MCAMNVEIVMQNLTALRAAVFTLSGKTSGGGADIRPPPSVRGLSLRITIMVPNVQEDFFVETPGYYGHKGAS